MEPVIFTSEEAFENSVIDNLRQHGWGHEPVLRYPTEDDLVNNWANILFKNNNEIDRLNGQELTRGEMQQIIDQLVALGSPQEMPLLMARHLLSSVTIQMMYFTTEKKLV